MKAPFLNLHEWIRRLGCKYTGEASAPVGEIVQPVAIVADHRGLVAPLAPPSAMLGFLTTATAGNPFIIRLISMGAGGTFIREVSWSAGAAATIWTLYAEPLLPGSPFFPPPAPPGDPYVQVVSRTARPQPLSPIPIRSTLIGGESYAAPALNAALQPAIRIAANGRQTISQSLYLPPGWAFVAECDSATPDVRIYMIVDEVPAPVAPVE